MKTSITKVVIICLLATYGGVMAYEELIDAPPASSSDPQPPLPAGDSGAYPDAQTRINKRATTCGSASLMTAAQKTESLLWHNQYRTLEPGANLFQMGWDENLAAQAQAWAQNCIWQHGMLTDCDGNTIGQNLYMIYGTSNFQPLNMTQTITSWNNERQNWNFSSNSCQSGKVCGHWTQVVWDVSTLVGCGYAQCPSMTMSDGSTVSKAVFVVCNYSPPGNVVGKTMYTSGSACSACSSFTRAQSTNRGYKCINELCVPCSPASDTSCQCGTPDTCFNGGSWSNVDCSCKCASGFFGVTCQKACVDVASKDSCKYWAGLGYCSSTSVYYSYMVQNCVSTCSACF